MEPFNHCKLIAEIAADNMFDEYVLAGALSEEEFEKVIEFFGEYMRESYQEYIKSIKK